MNKAYYAEKGLFVGITSVVCAFYFFAPTLFTLKSSLIEINGEISELNIYYTSVESYRGSNSIKSELQFTLNSSQSRYVLMKNIGQSGINERFENLENQLRQSGSASVWIKQSQKDEYKPTVFQIADKNRSVIYGFEESKSHSRFGFLISFALGIFGIGLWVRHKYFKNPDMRKSKRISFF
ncbi:hypothetical protein FPF71_05160 [Algibacter amylolyticus]|uniref:DUF3592 domain-containing protein n=1 Tax=Algibacter amylolyticus TaxID=1608400 RepID=A0A5M7B9B1_9FLAO|nr:hypothetical protein [Algibacter amylolyticus]KAA5826203.1 hypothetical protein F2B50_05160 [Algibacter amylolyticus]MBB5268405.1 hypothetical protein [Algibacter amylolyticus]TSJ80241.1 hypothetical protein FPF71_05160 [Algibacter amylolyticus]